MNLCTRRHLDPELFNLSSIQQLQAVVVTREGTECGSGKHPSQSRTLLASVLRNPLVDPLYVVNCSGTRPNQERLVVFLVRLANCLLVIAPGSPDPTQVAVICSLSADYFSLRPFSQ